MKLSIDYLILNAIGNFDLVDFESIRTDRVAFRECQFPTKNFKRVIECYIDGKQVGTFFCVPHAGSVIDKGFAQFQAKNWFLYQPSGVVLAELNMIAGSINAVWTGINRLDIALDGAESSYSGAVVDLPSYINDNAVLIAGKEKVMQVMTTTKGKYTGYTIGKRSSNKFLRFYNKTEQLKEVSKPWVVAGLRTFCNYDHETVYRMEIQLNRKYLSHITDISVCFNYRFIKSMFEASLRGFFELYENEGKERVSRNPQIEIYNETKLKNWLRCIKDKEACFFKGKAFQAEESTETQDRKLLKKMFCRYVRNQDNIAPLVIFTEIISNNERMLEFFYQKRQFWLVEIEKRGLFEQIDYQLMWNRVDEIAESLSNF